MTSGQFHSILISSIIVNREERQRRALSNIAVLADSISRLGLIHPIVCTRDFFLVAGERRLAACVSLGWTSIPVQWVDELDPSELLAIEYEENIKRTDLTWVEQTAATRKYHEYRLSKDPTWTEQKTADAIGVTKQSVSQHLTLAREIETGNPKVALAKEQSTALGIINRRKEREAAAQAEALRDIEVPTIIKTADSVLTANFNEWALTYTGPRFNLIHCDFPYGINAHKFQMGPDGVTHLSEGTYEDTPETYRTLLGTLLTRCDNICAESCHIIFWFSMEYYAETLDALRTKFEVSAFPLIWFKSDNTGILPDPQRGPRRVYETAFFGSRGDRKVVSAVSNLYAAPPSRDSHMSSKSEPMLRNFFRMVVDETTSLLDPTCGSGGALRAAEVLGAERVLGLEIDPEFAERARVGLSHARSLEAAFKASEQAKR